GGDQRGTLPIQPETRRPARGGGGQPVRAVDEPGARVVPAETELADRGGEPVPRRRREAAFDHPPTVRASPALTARGAVDPQSRQNCALAPPGGRSFAKTAALWRAEGAVSPKG